MDWNSKTKEELIIIIKGLKLDFDMMVDNRNAFRSKLKEVMGDEYNKFDMIEYQVELERNLESVWKPI